MTNFVELIILNSTTGIIGRSNSVRHGQGVVATSLTIDLKRTSWTHVTFPIRAVTFYGADWGSVPEELKELIYQWGTAWREETGEHISILCLPKPRPPSPSGFLLREVLRFDADEGTQQ